MERNPNDMGGASAENGATGRTEQGYDGGSTGAVPSGVSGGSVPLNTGVPAASPLADVYAATQGATTPGTTSPGATAPGATADQAREALGSAAAQARDFKQSLEQTLAEKLESGASRLRARGGEGAAGAPGTPAWAGGAAARGAAALQGSPQAERVAEGMERTAKWLREGDLRTTVEEQARANPGRTLLVALGVGYLLGKALKRR